MRKKLLYDASTSPTVISDDATCFIVSELQNTMNQSRIDSMSVLAYAPMPSGKADRMRGTIKRFICRLIVSNSFSRDKALPKALYGYRRPCGQSDFYPIEVLFDPPSRTTPIEHGALNYTAGDDARISEIITVRNIRAAWAVKNSSGAENKKPKLFHIGKKVLSAKRPAVQQIVKWSAFQSKYSEFIENQTTRQPRYVLKSKTGRHSRRAAHAWGHLPHQKSSKAEVKTPVSFNTVLAVRESRLFYNHASSNFHGVSISTSIQLITANRNELQIIAYVAVHICLCFHKMVGQFIQPTTLPILNRPKGTPPPSPVAHFKTRREEKQWKIFILLKESLWGKTNLLRNNLRRSPAII